jgi:hypothetical protein
MPRKVRHPYQILEASELVKDEEYVFVSISDGGGNWVETHLFGGAFKDSGDIVKNPPRIASPPIMTIHLDGKHPDFKNKDEPIFVYWKKFTGWDWMSTYLGDTNTTNPLIDNHAIIPKKHWDNDPKLHVLDWENPDDVVERKIHTSSNVDMDWEQKINARRDAAMAKAFGF